MQSDVVASNLTAILKLLSPQQRDAFQPLLEKPVSNKPFN